MPKLLKKLEKKIIKIIKDFKKGSILIIRVNAINISCKRVWNNRIYNNKNKKNLN